MRHAAVYNDYDRLVARIRHVRTLHGDTAPRQVATLGRLRGGDHPKTVAALAVCWALCVILPFASGLHTQAIISRRAVAPVGKPPPPLVRDALTRLLSVTPVVRLTTTAGTAEVDAWSPNGRYLAVGYSGGALLLWDVARRRLAARVGQAHHRFIGALSWSPDGRLLASAAADGTAVVWDARALPALRAVAIIRTAPLRVPAVAFAPRGDLLAVANGLHAVTLWDVSPRRPGASGARLERTLRLAGRTTALAWSPDGARLAVGTSEGHVVQWRRDGWRSVVRTLGSEVWALAWAPSGTTLAAGCADGAVRLLSTANLATRSVLVAPFHRAPVRQAADYGAPVAPVVRARAKNHTKVNGIHIAAGGAINGLAWSPGGDLLAVTATGVPLRLWRPSSGAVLATYRPAWDQNVVSWRPDGTLAAVAMDDGSVVLLRAASPAFPTTVACRAHIRDWCALLSRPLAPAPDRRSGVPPAFMGR